MNKNYRGIGDSYYNAANATKRAKRYYFINDGLIRIAPTGLTIETTKNHFPEFHSISYLQLNND